MRTALGAALLLALTIPPGAAADSGQEIAHLLQFIGESGCVFIRNGKEHADAEAREHIGKKYGYVRGRVGSAEEFIEYTATRSSTTGKPYLVRCAGQELPAADWLQAELGSYRLLRNNSLSGDKRSEP